MIFAGIATQISSLTWKTFGFLIYTYTGSDYGFFHIIYLLMHSISESLVIALIVLIGFGWTINYKTIPEVDLYIPIRNIIPNHSWLPGLHERSSNNAHQNSKWIA
jgi:hypothetical protein